MGPTAGLIFAELGAEVIKVEPAPKGDPTRVLGGFAAGFFPAFNRNKKSVAIDLKRQEGQAVLHRLAAGADVLLENYAPGTMERLGCGYDEIAKVNPRLVYLALKGYLTGPYQHRPALDEVVQFQSGLAYMTGPPGRPLRAGASIIDILGAAFGVIAAQAALHERATTGKGQRVSSALFESAAFLMSTHMAGFAATGEEPPPMPARRSAWAIYDVFETAGQADGNPGALFVGVTSDQQWRRFTSEFALDDLAADPRLATNQQRIAERPWLIPALQEALARLPQTEVEQRCERANVSWSPIARPADLFADAHLQATNGLLDVLIARTGSGGSGQSEPQPTGLPAMPLEFGADRRRTTLTSQPPALGADTRQTLAAAGYAPDEITQLMEDGVIVSPP